MIERLATFAMGTRFELVLAGDDARRLRFVGEAALARIEELDRLWSLFRRDSFLSFLNAHAPRRPVRLDEDTWEILCLAVEVWRASGGLFDVTLASAMRRVGFHEDAPALPADATGADALLLDPAARTLRFTRPVALDLGGIAKGYAIDAAAAVLREHAVACALLHGGTSAVAAIGAPPGEDGWRVALAGGLGPPVALLRDRCLAVSAPHGRVVESEGRRLGHVLDPRTGAPAACAAAAAVIGPRAAIADAWAKAALIERARPSAIPPSYTVAVADGPEDRPRWRVTGPAPELIEPGDHASFAARET